MSDKFKVGEICWVISDVFGKRECEIIGPKLERWTDWKDGSKTCEPVYEILIPSIDPKPWHVKEERLRKKNEPPEGFANFWEKVLKTPELETA